MFEPSELNEAVAAGLISAEQAAQLDAWQRTRAAAPVTATTAKPEFDLLHLLYYGGALLVIWAMFWWLSSAVHLLSGWKIFWTALIYAGAFTLLGRLLHRSFTVASGLLYTLAVCMTPLAAYGLELALGWWPPAGRFGAFGYVRAQPALHGQWAGLWAATLVVSLIYLWRVRFPFLVAPVSLAFSWLVVESALWRWPHASFRTQCWVTVLTGLALLLVGWAADRRSEEDFSFWLYLFGAGLFLGALLAMPNVTEAGKLVIFIISIALLNAALLLQRKVFLVYGGIGCVYYLGHLADTVFRNSLGVPLTLSLLGIVIILAGVMFQRHRDHLEASLLQALPGSLRQALPRFRTLN